MKSAIYPGSFDPITNGHLDVIKRGAKIFDKVVVAVANNPGKRPLFTLEERIGMVKKATKGMKNVRVDMFDGMVVHYVKSQRTNVILRGIRTVSDFEYEFQMALTNRKLGGVETVFVMASEEYSYLNSGLIKEVASLGGSIRAFVPPDVEKQLKEKLRGEFRETHLG